MATHQRDTSLLFSRVGCLSLIETADTQSRLFSELQLLLCCDLLRRRRLGQVETGDGQLDDRRGGSGRWSRGRERVEDATDARVVRFREIRTGKLAVRLSVRVRVLDALATYQQQQQHY